MTPGGHKIITFKSSSTKCVSSRNNYLCIVGHDQTFVWMECLILAVWTSGLWAL